MINYQFHRTLSSSKLDSLEYYFRNDKNKFWKEIKRLSKKSKPTLVDGLTKNEDIANLFTDQFKSIFDDPNSQSSLSISSPKNSMYLIKSFFTLEKINDTYYK